MAWVKLHDDILGDPKLMRAARVGGQELVLLPWLLAFASKSADHGRLSVGATAAEPEDIAYQIPGVTAAQVEAALRALVAIGVLFADEDGCLRFTKWEERQAKPSDSKSAWRERKQRSREKAKTGKESVTPQKAGQGVTRSRKDGHAGDVTPRHATDKRRGEEKRGEVEENTSPAADASDGASAPDVTPLVAPAVVVTTPKKGAAAAEPREPSWPAVGAKWWLDNVGDITIGRFGKAMTNVVGVHGWGVVFPDMQRWVQEQKAAGRTLKLEWYAEGASARITAEEPPMYDYERMELTPYGERKSRPDKAVA